MIQRARLRTVLMLVALTSAIAMILFGTLQNKLFVGTPLPWPRETKYRSPAPNMTNLVFLPYVVKEDFPAKPGWSLRFNDEFAAAQLDTNKWQPQYWWGRTNPPELQYYAPDSFGFGSGRLRIKGERRQMEGYSYTSGLISSRESLQLTFGYVEAKVKVPKGQGLWSAFWLTALSHQSSAEIDVMEILGDEPRNVVTSLHWNDPQGAAQQFGSTFTGPDFSGDYHIFAADWSPTAVVWYVDGIECFRMTENVPQEPMYLIANLAIGGTWPGYPDGTTVFPAYFDIDYIRAYKR